MSAAVQLSHCAYGKRGVRLVKVERRGARHDLRDIDVAVQVLGAFETAYSEGDNRSILPTDTMKNIVYALARQQSLGEIEDFGTRIANHLLTRNPHLTNVQITISENIWERIMCDCQLHNSAFQISGPVFRIARIDSSGTKTSIRAGIRNLVVMKTSRSAFESFLRDEYTTLKETRDRLFGSTVDAEWSYGGVVNDFKEAWRCMRDILLSAFAKHDSLSVQHTLYAMGQAALQQVDAIEQISLSMPNRHCVLVDLSPFGLDNPNEVFIPVDEPSGSIEATLRRALPADEEK